MPFDRRRFTAGAMSAWLCPVLLGGCGEDSASATGFTSTPSPTPTPTPAPTPAPSPTPTPSPSGPLTLAFVGSSSPEQYLTLYNGGPTRADVLASSNGVSFTPLATGAFGKSAGAAIATATGRPVRFIRGGVGGSTLASWVEPGSTYRAAIVRSIVAAGVVDAVLIQVGRNDAANRIVADLATQTARVRTLIAQLRGETGLPALQVFIGGSQDLLTADDQQYRMMGIQRQAEGRVANEDAGVRYAFATYDLPTMDGVHQSEASQSVSGARFAAQVVAWLQSGPQSRGPQFAGARALGPTQTEVTLLPGSGTDVALLSGIDGFRVETAAGVRAISAAERVSATTVRLTHASTGGQTATVSYALFADTDDDRCLRGNDALALPMEPSWLPATLPVG